MGKPQRKKRTHKNVKDFKKSLRTRKRTKDIDQVHDELGEKNQVKDKILHQIIDSDLPGDGQFYCLICTRYFLNEKTLIDHKKTKNHKKRFRLMKEKPYSHAEAELAAGMGSYTVKGDKKAVGEKTNYTNDASCISPAILTNTTTDMNELAIDET